MGFNKDDVIKVARALLDLHYEWGNGDYDDGTTACNYCDGSTDEVDYRVEPDHNDIKHTTGCPVLVARDLLTGAI